tara:strand:+ start:261 stop:638 length:378 start_codon:yes stop_codon:yes gene_type:complete
MAKDQVGPSYYKRGTIDVWDFIRENGLNFHLGNAVKYICRAGYKDSKVEDLKKAIHYLENELTNAERQNLPRYDQADSIVFGGSGVPGGLSDSIVEFPFSESQAAQPYSGGVQGVFGSGRDVISF